VNAVSHCPLPTGFKVDHYEVESVLGRPGTFGITYSAFPCGDKRRRVAIKELFPPAWVIRELPSQTVVAQGRREAVAFNNAVEMFRNEAKLLSRLSHPNIVRIFDYLETNGTGYLVMEFEYGYNLEAHLRMQTMRLNENELLNLLLPLLEGLEQAHRISCLHRDIKPANIYITRDHRPLLLDFGAAREMVVSRTTSLSAILTPGFAPPEQYTSSQRQGPFTDIYALGAVLHVAMTGAVPPEALRRVTSDSYVPLAVRLAGQEYSLSFLSAVDAALALPAAERPQSIAEWRKQLTEKVPERIIQHAIPDFSTTSFARAESVLRRAMPMAFDEDRPTPARPQKPSISFETKRVRGRDLRLAGGIFIAALFLVLLVLWLLV